MTNWLIGGLVVLAIIVGGFFLVGSDSNDAMTEEGPLTKDEMMETSAMQKDGAMTESKDSMMGNEGAMMDGEMMTKGSYEAYAPEKLAKANTGDVVLFFRAAWCPTCKALDGDIRANLDRIPAGVTILDVNYDTETALKQKYGVTYQHTLVQVDADGNMITKWSGGLALSDLISKVQ